MARWHFAPTARARENLRREGVADAGIMVTGNTVIDALLRVLQGIEADDARRAALREGLNARLPFDWTGQRFVLVTGHRRESFGEGFLEICRALKDLAARYPEIHFVYPVHLNPNVRQPVTAILTGRANVHLLEPLEYEPFIYLLKHSHLVLTDSGGIQEEAPSLGKPVLVMRRASDRPEAIEAGTVRLVGADRERIVANVIQLLEDEVTYRSMARAYNPYGDGKACERIVAVLRGAFS
ncbi:MAG: UDP-N-acetylglucosamine 2-epimerase (non-hydrolysing)/UDP-N-acetylglucosamine 2-epimerase (hydrolysing) [Candidatus Kentron sp. G]|nr:MAG: UDP-N-acetylglucosamine 2-epimerase (non-hydrolysing)/UDP-N-acetylglucosamine 2-epimerase (hydrolysing) [Candidatus Kentron sp. G]VFN06715.1 MAG: UDP-N-acetylglucosamine 2-epimerase (non-hydrolysing)/UDP-N-acetylglucosamine 2-epimerase (hydrolysing) [Candidatus Kentron sp. G]VFN07537.1 MAG: UDP-N-acetylglucosamine 2-epimerase (non-hydrolysing)/UDP-N-acetylglucosamine 2-epimerase (hydrolysing) [Candidatus Kentron sp. G]